MKWFWASLAIGGLAISGADAKCNCNFLNPRIEAPKIGTRNSTKGPLSEAKSADTDAKYLGCDVKFWNIPEGSTISVVFNYYENEDDKTPEQQATLKGDPDPISGNGEWTTALPSGGTFPDGVYECEWTIDSSKKIDNSPAKARITVGTPPKHGHQKGKAKGDDDDKGSKKKKKGDDDDDDK